LSGDTTIAGARDTILAQLADGKAVDIGLLEAMAKTPLADLSATAERARLWSRLPTSQRDNYLQATATGWLNAAAKGTAFTPPEAELEGAIMLSSSLQYVLERSSVTVDACLSIVIALPSFPEEVFITLLNSLFRGVQILSHPDAEKLGALVASRRWERAAKYLSDLLADHRPYLMPGLSDLAQKTAPASYGDYAAIAAWV
jgi:hypothetical protein